MFGTFTLRPELRTPLKMRERIPERFSQFPGQQPICNYDEGMEWAWLRSTIK